LIELYFLEEEGVRKPIHCLLAGAIAAALTFATPAVAQEKVKIGFITTMTGPQGVIGGYMRDSVELALDHLGRKVGGLEVEMVYGDDQFKPDVGVQVAE
jgi:branched-chain amino acid transport system substrate-binding protein